MIVRGPRPDGNFYVLSKSISEDGRLSWAARGLLVFLLGKPDHWRVSPAALVNEVANSAKPTGRDATYALLGELIEAGYIVRERDRAAGGEMGPVRYIVRELPLTEFQEVAGSPLPASPDTAQPDAAKPTQARTDAEQGLIGEEGLSAQKRRQAIDPITFDTERAVFVGVSSDLIAKWRLAYPQIDPEAELVRASLWLTANPGRRPKSRLSRFLNAWMARARVPQRMAGNGRAERAAEAARILTGGLMSEQSRGGAYVVDADAREVHRA